MSRRARSQLVSARRAHAPVFAALGDTTRLALVTKLCARSPQTISQLSKGAAVTRQAITKHLVTLESAGVVYRVRKGRECYFAFEPERVKELRKYLELVTSQWDESLGRLKRFVEG